MTNRDTTYSITQLLYHEAQLLDEGRFEEWLALLSPDIDYRAPIQRDTANDWVSKSRHELSYLAENIGTLQLRVGKIRTGLQQTELPLSRTVRLISNVQVKEVESEPGHEVRSAFILYRNHRQRDVEILAGHRLDLWVESKSGFLLKKRQIYFAANVLPTKSLSLFY